MNESAEDLVRVIDGYYRAKNAAVYGETVVCAMQQVNENNYCMVWTTEMQATP